MARMRIPGDDTPEPPGGRAAERLREFVRERLPAGADPGADADEAADAGTVTEKPVTGGDAANGCDDSTDRGRKAERP
jgi:hypothetical protein